MKTVKKLNKKKLTIKFSIITTLILLTILFISAIYFDFIKKNLQEAHAQNNLDISVEGLILHLDASSFNYVYDDFSENLLNSEIWETFGEEHGSISINNGELTISQTNRGTSGANLIGIASKQKFPIGYSYRARVKNTSGRHAAVIGFGQSPWPNYPHGGNNIGLTWYSRADNITSVISYCDENLDKGTYSTNITQDLRNYQIIEFYRVDENTIEIYRDEVLEQTLNNLIWEDDYSFYISLDGHTTTNTVVIDWIEIVKKDDSKVYKWNDLSGQENHAIQTLEANRPIYKTNIINNLPVIRFNNSNSTHLQIANGIKPDEITIFAVRKVNNAGSHNNFIIDTSAQQSFNGSDGYRFDNYNGTARLGINSTFITAASGSTEFQIQTGRKKAGNRNLYLDGNLVSSDSQAGNITYGSITKTTIGALQTTADGSGTNLHLDGDIAEILIYNTYLPDEDRETVEQYLGEKWLDWEPQANVSTLNINQITNTSAQFNADLNEQADKKGFVYGIVSNANPGNVSPENTTYNNYIEKTGNFSPGIFNENITGLTSETVYFVRSFARINDQYQYGEEILFATILTPIMDGLVLQLDASLLTGLNDDELVEVWYDVSGQGNNARQETIINRPTYKTNILNGRPIIRFDGNNKYLFGDGLGITGSSSSTVFIVTRRDTMNQSTNTGVFSYGNITGDGGSVRRYSIDSQGLGVRFNNGNRIFTDPTNTSNFFIQTHQNIDGASYGQHELYVNSDIQSQVSTGSSSNIPNIINTEYLVAAGRSTNGNIPIGDYFRGDIAEIIVYNRALSSSERVETEQYLGEKWLGWEPNIITQDIDQITDTSAQVNAQLNKQADKKGFVYGAISTTNPGNVSPENTAYSNYIEKTGNFSPGVFNENITGLTSETVYFVRSFAYIDGWYQYGEELTFTTVSLSMLVTEGLFLHLDASAITSLTNNDPVVTWHDLSGQENHATGGTFNSGNLPTYEIYEGMPAVKFHGNADGSYFDLGADLYAKSVFFVTQLDSDAPGLSCITTTKLNSFPWSIRASNPANWRLSEDGNGWINPENQLFVNGSDTPDASIPNNIDRHMFYAEVGSSNEASKFFRYIGASEHGNSRWYKGRISEVLFYDKKLSPEERKQVEQYLGEKWLGWEPEIPITSITHNTYISSLQKGLIGHWTLNEIDHNPSTQRISDLTPYGNHGTNHGAIFAEDRVNKTGKAMSFNGTSSYIEAPDDPFNFEKKDVTLVAWIKTTGSDQSIVANQAPRNTTYGWNGINFWINSNGKLQPVVSWNTSTSDIGYIIGNTTVNDGNWKHVAFVLSGANRTNWRIFVNGSLDSFSEFGSDLTGDGINNDIPLTIGSGAFAGGSGYFNGLMDDIRIYNRALSTKEIQQLYSLYNHKIIISHDNFPTVIHKIDNE